LVNVSGLFEPVVVGLGSSLQIGFGFNLRTWLGKGRTKFTKKLYLFYANQSRHFARMWFLSKVFDEILFVILG
jgi:hypothetical protein